MQNDRHATWDRIKIFLKNTFNLSKKEYNQKKEEKMIIIRAMAWFAYGMLAGLILAGLIYQYLC